LASNSLSSRTNVEGGFVAGIVLVVEVCDGGTDLKAENEGGWISSISESDSLRALDAEVGGATAGPGSVEYCPANSEEVWDRASKGDSCGIYKSSSSTSIALKGVDMVVL
jgi:hypothetical protein